MAQALRFEDNFATPPLRGHAASRTPLPWELEAYRKVKNLKKRNKRRSSSEMEWTVTPTAAGPSGGAPVATPNSPAAPPTCPNCDAAVVMVERCQALLDNVLRTLNQ
jgi:hypothetical protein